ncbi:TSUP family transporter [Anaeroselena agilis]|uniref:Probable membrane transporter protein n=1 Tax=Anaeroselena agilis TaxID=3063788 RepID=A0ABU3NU45_9FIRM|nr:sulfite exporter TauE/SafE family protein [Selenomonadales bacterium 4137-cl]
MYLLLFIGGFIAAAISGAAGFGGALLLLPLLTQTIGPTMAVPVLTIAQLIGNLSRVYFGYKEIKWRPVALFIIGAIPMSVIGALSFVNIPKEIVTKIIGVAVICFVILKHYQIIKFEGNKRTMIIGGSFVGLFSGLVGSAGPLGAALFLALNLSPVSYISSEAVTAVTMHIVKTIVYQKYLDIGLEALELGLFIGVAMVAGTWAGKKVIEKLPKEIFVKGVTILLLIIGLELVLYG